MFLLKTRLIRRLAAAALLCAPLMATSRPAAAQSEPPDDGAPPSEYNSAPWARVLTSLSTELPTRPPADNAFPILGASRSACTDSFGDGRAGGRIHMGVDCFAPLGTPLVATEAGTIRYAEFGEPFDCVRGGDFSGNRVSLRGRSGYLYYYGHLDTILVTNEQEVVKGQVIGTLGRTGNAQCSGPHLHLEVRCESGDPFDPFGPMETWGRPSPPPPEWPSTELMGAGGTYSGSHRQDLFALECGEVIRQKSEMRPGGISETWYPVDGLATSDPDAASPSEEALPQVFVRGTDHATYQLYWSGSTWSAVSLGGLCTSGPAAAYPTPLHLDVVCRGSDDALYQRTWTSTTGWIPGWALIPGRFTSDPDAAIPASGAATQLFVRGPDDAAYQLYREGATWVSVSLGGTCTSGPSAAYSGPDRLDVFCRGSDLALYHRYWLRSSGWAPHWERIDSKIISDPEAVSAPGNRTPDVFVRGVDRRIYQFFWNGTGWARTIWGVT
jgi:murein DD-endopeptidase MepM/ murein hydrolase activator NlpD